jgi:hypothetical protein
MDFHVDVHWDFHVTSWHVSCLLVLLALLLSQNVVVLFGERNKLNVTVDTHTGTKHKTA